MYFISPKVSLTQCISTHLYKTKFIFLPIIVFLLLISAKLSWLISNLAISHLSSNVGELAWLAENPVKNAAENNSETIAFFEMDTRTIVWNAT